MVVRKSTYPEPKPDREVCGYCEYVMAMTELRRLRPLEALDVVMTNRFVCRDDKACLRRMEVHGN